MIARAKMYKNKSIFATIFGKMLRFADKSFYCYYFVQVIQWKMVKWFKKQISKEKIMKKNPFNNCLKNNRFSLQEISSSEIISIFWMATQFNKKFWFSEAETR